LERFLPIGLNGGVEYRAALASTLVAGLELVRTGALKLRQEQTFGPILVSPRRADGRADG
jgi:segregation and condensation protein A